MNPTDLPPDQPPDPPAEWEALAERLTVLRKRTTWTQGKIAGLLGIGRGLVVRWEGAHAVPDLLQARALASLYMVTLDVLAGVAPMPAIEPKKRRSREH